MSAGFRGRFLLVWASVAMFGGALTLFTTRPAAGQEEPMDRTITFRPERVYEVTGIWVKEGKQPQLDAYFGDVFPIAAADYGVKPLFGLAPVSAYAGDFLPDVMFVNEWPSLERFRAFVEDPRAVAMFPRRDEAVSRLVVTQYSVPAESSVTVRPGDLVEFAAMWIKPGREEELQAYYQEAVEIARQNGLRPMTGLSPVYSYQGDYMPGRAGLNLWGTKANFDRFAAAARPLFPRRDAALQRLEVTHAEVRFDPEG